MTYRITIFFALICIFYSCERKSDLISNCKCNKIDLQDGMKVTDKFDRFEIMIPNENWNPTTEYSEEIGNGIDTAILDGDCTKYFGVVEIKKGDNWTNINDEIDKYQELTKPIESGFIKINNVEFAWNFIEYNDESPQRLSLMLYAEHPNENYIYCLNLSVSKNCYTKENLCELENLLKSFRIKNNIAQHRV